MGGNGELARRALALVEGVVRGEQAAENLLVEAFSSVDEAAHAHAYLCGFMLQMLATANDESHTASAARVRDLLSRVP